MDRKKEHQAQIAWDILTRQFLPGQSFRTDAAAARVAPPTPPC
jgi:hypothetical protein